MRAPFYTTLLITAIVLLVHNRIGQCADADQAVGVTFADNKTELDTLKTGAKYFTNWTDTIQKVPGELSGLKFTCRHQGGKGNVTITVHPKSTVYILVDSDKDPHTKDAAREKINQALADSGWTRMSETAYLENPGHPILAIYRQTFPHTREVVIANDTVDGIVVAAKSLALIPADHTVAKKQDVPAGHSNDSTQPSVHQGRGVVFGHFHEPASICYICDGSAGMTVGAKDEILKQQLSRAVANLAPAQTMNVLIYQDGQKASKFVSMFGKLVPASPENDKKVDDYMQNTLMFHGKSNPLPAMEEAFKERPEVIFLMAGGDFDGADAAKVEVKIKGWNQDKKVIVHTILLFKDKDEEKGAGKIEGVMEKIADENGGNFNYFFADNL